jgi:hypothetical protein
MRTVVIIIFGCLFLAGIMFSIVVNSNRGSRITELINHSKLNGKLAYELELRLWCKNHNVDIDYAAVDSAFYNHYNNWPKTK